MSHSLVKATIIPEIINLVTNRYGITHDEAIDVFYNSKTALALADDETGLYGQSPLFIFSLFVDEYTNKSEEE